MPPDPDPEWFETTPPPALKKFLKEVEQYPHPSKVMSLKLEPEDQSWVAQYFDEVSEHFSSNEASLWKAITANENLAHVVHMRANIDFPSVGKVTSKNPDLCIFALDPTWTLKNDVWPLFVMEIVYVESCWKPMRDILEALLGIEHEGDMRGTLCLKTNLFGMRSYYKVGVVDHGEIDKEHLTPENNIIFGPDFLNIPSCIHLPAKELWHEVVHQEKVRAIQLADQFYASLTIVHTIKCC
ncbi:hypothetical protein ARMGADRAFT_1030178 [Armillaria gallica]|uniref:Uncharacterized protein n=1 Tax=Armillaria gallica TaxID=47427 RepID=A0A2H3DEC2_ARMGA|nr:hypothetical protein ARMGADRAFT_1030178 [Armillaria gallica]